MTHSSTRRREKYLISGIAALYLLLWLMIPKPAFWGVDNGVKFQGMKAFAETGKIVVLNSPVGLGIGSKFRSLQPPFGIMTSNGQVPVFSPLFLVLGGIFIKLFGDTGPFLLPLLGGWAVLLASWFLWLQQRESHDGTLFLLLVGFGSPILFYSLALWEHTLATAALTYAIALLCPARAKIFNPNDLTGLFPAGALIGLASGFRSEVVLWALIIMVFWKGTGHSNRTRMRFVFGLLAGLAFVGLINYWQTSVPYPLHILSNIRVRPPNSIFALIVSRVQNFYILLLQGYPSNAMSVVGLFPIGVVMLWQNWRDEGSWRPYIAGSMILAGAYYLFSIFTAPNMIANTTESGGLLWVMPVAALALVPLMGERRKYWMLVFGGIWGTILLLSAFNPAMKGIHWGPRHLIIVIPIILMYATVRIQRWWSRYQQTRIVIVVLVVLSLANQATSLLLEFRANAYNRDLNFWAQEFKADVVVTRNWWLPGDCSLVSYKQPWFVVKDGEMLAPIVNTLKKNGKQNIHYIESPPYLSENFLLRVGLKEVVIDYFDPNFAELKHSTLEIISEAEVPLKDLAPVDNPVSK